LQRAPDLALFVFLGPPVSVAPRPEECSLLLLVKPAKELPKPRIGPDLLDRVKRVAQFIVRPRFVDEVLT
jgi:hypothetical protein